LIPARLCALASFEFRKASAATKNDSDNSLIGFEFIYISRFFDKDTSKY
jgi:hypothetical protein